MIEKSFFASLRENFKHMKSYNPANEQFIKEYKEYSPEECGKIIDQVYHTWKSWKETSFTERGKLMHNAANILRSKKQQYAEIMTLEMGKLISESTAEIEKSAWVCDFYAENAEKFLRDEIVETDASQSFVTFNPRGPVLAVMPWNFPFWQVFRFAAPALMAGNAGILKHASNVQACALAIEDVFREAGFPDNLFRTLVIPSGDVEKIICNEKITAVTLTGSELAGSKVAEVSGRNIKKTVMELGGSDPFIVLEDADIEKCAKTAQTARLLNTGQSCIAAKRFIVHEKIADEFISLQKKLMEKLIPGDPMNPDTRYGPMARLDLLEEIHRQVYESVKMGAELITGGKRIERNGFYYQPTLIVNVTQNMPVFCQETFGPVMAVMQIKNEKEAIAVANNSIYGLGGCVWTKDIKRGIRIARQIESGAVFVNGMTKSDPRMPFGGIKRSGYGRELSHYGIKEFVNIKTVWVT